MKAKLFFVSIISVLIFSILFGYSLVFGSGIIFKSDIKLLAKIGDDVYLDSDKLNNLVLIFQSNKDLSKYYLSSTCKTESKFLGNQDNNYIFKVNFKDINCEDSILILKDDTGNSILDTKFSINFLFKSDLFSDFSDYETNFLNKLQASANIKLKKLSVFKNYNGNLNLDYKNYFSKNRLFNEIYYKKEILDNILERRRELYKIPVEGYSLPTIKNKSKLPNTGRPYREAYTQGIHSGWDIDTPFRENVLALDDSVVIRVVENFSKDDLLKINYSKDLSYEDKIRNLDLLRGNQVWLKTSKGDIVFYGHLDKIFTDIKEGSIIKVGTPVGTVGISGVPDDEYKDYHLHFEIHKNPYNVEKAGKYDIVDYMKWDWYYKGKTPEYIDEHQKEVFDLN